MLTFREYLNEHVLSIGLNPKHEKYREHYRQQFHDILHNSYAKIGGYGGLKSGSKEESDDIHKDISNHIIKAHVRNGKISALNIYKNQHGRKSIAVGTDSSDQGKSDFKMTKREDDKHKRAWGEVSGAVQAFHAKLGTPIIPAKHAEKLLGKKVTPVDDHSYSRDIGGHPHVKQIVGHPKIKLDN